MREMTTKDEINCQDKYGFTALHSACSKPDVNPRILMVKSSTLLSSYNRRYCSITRESM